MTYYNLKTLTGRALGAALLLSVPGVVSADHSDIVVQPSPALEQWQQETSTDLNRALKRRAPFEQRINNAIVQVAFSAGEDGRPDTIEVLDGNGNWAAKRAAKRAVSTLDDLDDVPVANAQNVQFLANIIFADNERTRDRLEQRLIELEVDRLASAGPERTYIALRN